MQNTRVGTDIEGSQMGKDKNSIYSGYISKWEYDRHFTHKFHTPDKEHAKQMAEKLSKEHAHDFGVFWCRVCQTYHVGKKQPKSITTQDIQEKNEEENHGKGAGN